MIPNFIYNIKLASNLELLPYQGYYWTFEITALSNAALFHIFPVISFADGSLRFSLAPALAGNSDISFSVFFPGLNPNL